MIILVRDCLCQAEADGKGNATQQTQESKCVTTDVVVRCMVEPLSPK